MERVDTVLQTDQFDSIGNDIYESSDASFNLVIYQVDGDEIKNPQNLSVPSEFRKYQEDTAAHRRIWDFYIAIVPPEARSMVKEFVIYTDGELSYTGAWVRPSKTDPRRWQVGFDIRDSESPLFLADALLHETGHLLTLNDSQLPVDEGSYYIFDGEGNFPECPQVALDGKCSLADSYINQFFERFWTGIYTEWWEKAQEAGEMKTRREYLDVMEEFYDAHSDLFISDYAATNIKEDMAETFSYFILNPKPEGNTIPYQKVAFFYQFPELTALRDYAIRGICTYASE